MPVNTPMRTVGKARPTLHPTHHTQTMLDVLAGFQLAQRGQVTGSNNSLPQLLHAGVLQGLTKLLLPQQKTLQQRHGGRLKIRQHPQFLQRLDRQILRLVHHQQHSPPLPSVTAQKILEMLQQSGFAYILIRQTKCGCHTAQQLISFQLGRHQLGSDYLAGIQFGEQIVNQGRLTGSYSAGNDDKTLTLTQAVAQVCKRRL